MFYYGFIRNISVIIGKVIKPCLTHPLNNFFRSKEIMRNAGKNIKCQAAKEQIKKWFNN
jgi:hypothetical protein